MTRPAPPRPALVWEPCAGSAALSRALVGAPRRLVPQQGGKVRLTPVLLAALGLRPEQGADALVWSDPGPWGLVWPVLTDPARCEAVAEWLRDRATLGDAGAIWKWYAQQSIHCAPVERAGAFLLLQAGNGRGRPVGIKYGSWVTAGFAHVTPSARARGFTDRLDLRRLADRVEALAAVRWPSLRIEHGDARDLSVAGPDALVYIDPPYHLRGEVEAQRTGYDHDLPLEAVCELAARCADAGARVLVSEGGPLTKRLGPGWHSAEVTEHMTGRRTGAEWVTANFRLRPDAQPGRQMTLLAPTA